MEEGTAFAQYFSVPNPNNVLASPAPTAPVSSEWQQEQQPEAMNVFQEAGQAQVNPLPQIFRYGPYSIHPHADYSIMYATGLQPTPGDHENSLVQNVSPGIRFDLGKHWALDYTPTLQFYSNNKFQDAVNHSITLTGGFSYDSWVYGLNHNTTLESTPTTATGSQTDQAGHTTSFTAARALNSNMSTDLGFVQAINLVSGFADSYQWSTLDWLNYEFWPRMNGGIGIGAGYDWVTPDGSGSSADTDQYFEQMQARLNWRATDKISFQINAGFQYTEFSTAGQEDSLAPIFGAAIEYLPFRHTAISLNASRTVQPSTYYIVVQQVEVTLVSLAVSQELFHKFQLSASIGYSTTEYTSTIASFSLGSRTDDQTLFNIRLSHPFFKRGTWSIFYQYTDNQSDQALYTFNSDQTGFEINYSF